MISPDKFQEICARVFSKDTQCNIYCTSGYKKIYDEDTGEFLGNLLLFQAASDECNRMVGPVVWRDDYFQKEDQVEEFAESILEGVRKWLP